MSIFSGNVVFDNNSVSNTVNLSTFAPYDILHMAAGGLFFVLEIFSINMLTNYSPKDLKSGVEIELAADKLGKWTSGVTGAVWDDERDVWPIKMIKIKMRIVSDGVFMCFAGVTDAGYGTYAGGRIEPTRMGLKPLNYCVDVLIPLEKLYETFSVSPENVDSYNAKLEKIIGEYM